MSNPIIRESDLQERVGNSERFLLDMIEKLRKRVKRLERKQGKKV